MALKTYRDLEVWQRAMDLVVVVYRLAKDLPASERFGLTSQIQRATVSVPANIAEGYARRHRGDYVHHLSIAMGSLVELETHLTIAVRLEFIGRERAMEVWDLSQEVGRRLTRLMQSLETQRKRPQTPNPKPQTL